VIFDFPNQHGAKYDEDGNIILPSDDSGSHSSEHVLEEGTWTSIDDENAGSAEPPRSSRLTRRRNQPASIWQDARTKMRNVFHGFTEEGASQYRWSIRRMQRNSTATYRTLGKSLGILWSFLTQPVWIINPRKQSAKQYSRLTLFVLDTVRFGGTFAALFVFLFVSLNYQSFWQITQSYFNPVNYIHSANSRVSATQSALKEKLLRSPTLATAGSNNGDLLALLPGVGPPENRMIIPKLDLNIPLVTPSYQALLSENWEGLEKDIQDALQLGVVHYPGTARPGQAGNFFVTGHSSYYPWAPGKYKNVFARLHELNVGDEFWVYYGGDKYLYIIRNEEEVKPTNVNVLDQPVNRRTATLMTCTPVGTTLRRLILFAEEVDPLTGTSLVVGQQHAKPLPKINVESLPI